MIFMDKVKPLWMHGKDENVNQEVTLGELLFFVSFVAFFVKFTMDFSGVAPRNETMNTLLVGLSIACSMFKIFTQKYTPLNFAITMVICAVMGYSALISINYLFLLGFLLIMGMQNISLDKIMKFGFYAKVTNISIHVLWYIFVYITNPGAIQFVYRRSDQPRHTFFMGHANLFTAFLVWTCFDFMFINYKNLKVFHMAVIWLLNLIFYVFTDSNTGLIILAAITVVVIADKAGKGFFDKLLTILAKYAYLFFAVLFTVLSAIYTQLDGTAREMWHIFDRFLTGRIWFGAYAFYQYGPTLLGRPDMPSQNIFWQGRWFDTLTIFDNSYIGNLVSYGYINLIVTAIVFIVLCGRMENREKVLIIAFALYGIMEAYVTNLGMCSALFIVGKYIWTTKTKYTSDYAKITHNKVLGNNARQTALSDT